MTDEELELLDTYLDGELSPGETQRLRARLSVEPGLAAGVRQLQDERAMRSAWLESLEPSPAVVKEVVERAQTSLRFRQQRTLHRGWLRSAAALAACLVLGIVLGQFIPGRDGGAGDPLANQTAFVAVHPAVYEVAITDESGQMVAVQPFDSLEEARRFSDDLQRSQRQQEELFLTLATLRSARF